MDGVWRTRVGYAGGTTSDPTYRSIGDHTECFQVDFDPGQISYGELLGEFWASHSPTSPGRSTQYQALILTSGDEQHAAALDSRDAIAQRLGKRVHTQVTQLDTFYVAEEYHNKYALKRDRILHAEMEAYYPYPADLRESTAAARLNGYVYGLGSVVRLDGEIGQLGLTPRGEERLRSVVNRG